MKKKKKQRNPKQDMTSGYNKVARCRAARASKKRHSVSLIRIIFLAQIFYLSVRFAVELLFDRP